MGLLLVPVLLLLTGVALGEDNILLNKKVFASERPYYGYLLNDGDTYSNLLYFDSNKVKWAVFDLVDSYQLSSIVIWNWNYGTPGPINVYIGNEFQACKFHKQILNYKPCRLNVLQEDPSTTISCAENGNTGRYLAIVKGTFLTTDNLEVLNIFEVEAYGTLVSGSTIPTRPILIDGTLAPVPQDAFKISKAILSGVSSVTFPQYSSQMIFLNTECNPIIWDPSTYAVFALACQSPDKKGRLTVYGKDAYVNEMPEGTLKNNIFKWLSPNSKNPQVVSTENMKTVSDIKNMIKPGDIIDFHTWNEYSDEFITKIISLCLSGTNAITLDHTFWVSIDADVKAGIVRILETFNVGFPTTIINWDSAIEMPITDDSFKDDLLGVGLMLERMASNHDFFVTNGNSVAKQLFNIPASMITKSDVGSSLKKIIAKYDVLMNWICPCEVSPAIDPGDRAIINIYSQLLRSQALVNSNYKMPCIDLFPGDFSTPPATVTTTITVKSQTSNTLYPTGYYIAAGATLQYSVKASVGTWTISIGCHSDVLNDNRPEWSRYPYISTNYVDLSRSGQIYSPFGGVLWLGNIDPDQSITITLSNVVATPFFNGRDPTAVKAWSTQRKNPGLWSLIAGDTVVFCEKSSIVTVYDGNYMADLIHNNWDPLIKMDYAINGNDWKAGRPQIVVLDIMTEMGSGHSGYPIVVWYDWTDSIFKQATIDQYGSWGMCHEFGHNMQDPRWLFTGLSEVTNNLLCLFNYDKLWHLKRYGNDSRTLNDNADTITAYLDSGANFGDFQSNPWLALAIYSQMVNSMGWGMFKDAFEYYNVNKLDPADDDAKIETWIKTTSIVSGQNLLPLFEFWGLPISDNARNTVATLPCFFPDDFLTQFSAKQTNKILADYPDCSRKSRFFRDYDPTNDMKGSVPNFIVSS